MRASQPPADPHDQLRWLVDRAAISDLLHDFARSLDDRAWDSYIENFTDDAVLSIVPSLAEPGRHGDAGGWYDCDYRRTAEGWRFTRVALSVMWTAGNDLPGRTP